jgi:hypothetical protein
VRGDKALKTLLGGDKALKTLDMTLITADTISEFQTSHSISYNYLKTWPLKPAIYYLLGAKIL